MQNIIKLEDVTIHFPHLAKTQVQEFEDGSTSEYYSAAFLIRKDDVRKWSVIKKAEKDFSYEKLGYETDSLLKDGDIKNINFFADSFIINTKSKFKPQVLDMNKKPIPDDEIYKRVKKGTRVNAIIQLHVYNVNGKKGVSAYLLAVQVIENMNKSVKTHDFSDLF